MRRCVRDVRRALGVQLPAERGDDLTEQVELLENRLQRQARVVDQEQLALVVADVLAKLQGPLDHLLRAAHGQRRLGAELLQRRPVSVDGGVVEVRAELTDCGLAVLAHEHLAAEPDDRLVGLPVAVVLEVLPVEGHHPLGVRLRPEDVVVEEAVAVVRRLLGDLRTADGPVPHERRHPVQWSWGRGERLQRTTEAALPVHDLLAPEPAQQRVVLDRQRDAVPDVLAEPRVDRAGVAAAHHEVHAPAGEVLQHREVLGDLHRVVRRDEGGRRGQDQPLCPRSDVAEQGSRRGGDERRVVVLAGGEDVETDLFRLLRDRHHGRDPLGLRRCAAGRRVGSDVSDAEDPELHLGSLLAVID